MTKQLMNQKAIQIHVYNDWLNGLLSGNTNVCVIRDEIAT